MGQEGALWGYANPIILLVIDPCLAPLWPGLLPHPYGSLTRQLQLAAQVPYASFRNRLIFCIFSFVVRHQERVRTVRLEIFLDPLLGISEKPRFVTI